MKTLKLQRVTRYFGYILLCAVLFSSCFCGGNNQQDNSEMLNNDLTDSKVVVIDSCEYIQYHTYYHEAITHKGNCKYCAERMRRLLLK